MSRYLAQYLDNLYESEEQLRETIRIGIEKQDITREDLVAMSNARVRAIYEFITRYILDDDDSQFLRDISNAPKNLYLGEDRAAFEECLDHLFDLAVKMIIRPEYKFADRIEFRSSFGTVNWIRDGYSKPLAAYRLNEEKPLELACRNPVAINDALQRDKELGKTNNFNFFRYTNSSLVRRVVQEKEEVKAATDSIYPREFRLRGIHRNTVPAAGAPTLAE